MTDPVQPRMHVVQHTTTVSAPAELLYDLVADALNWPVILGPTVHVERLASEDSVELLRLWATANGEVRTWTSKRTLDRANMRITFRQQESPTPLASMGGAWTLQPLSATETRVVLDHDFSVVDDDPEATSWFAKAVDSNSTAELTAMKELAERWAERSALTISFSDSVRIRATARQVYDYLNETDKWPERIPHVSRAELTEDAPGLQVMVMDTSTADGTVHTTRSVRVCFPHDRIVYKQVETPALMSVHTGEWTLEQDADGVLATSRHTVVIRLEAVPEVLGPGASSADALQFVRAALSRNSTATLNHAKDFVESAGVHASTRA